MHFHKNRVLIILKKRHDYNGILHSHIGLSTGLFNSGTFINDMLNKNGIKSDLVVVNDNNDIDREVKKHKPTHVIIEALWVVPQKFDILHKLYPKVKWIIRLHSQIPFLSNEGIAMEWIAEYITKPKVYIGVNAIEAFNDIEYYVSSKIAYEYHEVKKKVVYLPNVYNEEFKKWKPIDKEKEFINIGCFGAIRPMKNQLAQAIAAIKFADIIGKKLNFHINVGRIEKGESVLKNIESLFKNLSPENYKLIKNEWLPRDEFLNLCSQMDLGLQCSFSETFNIVGADLISQGVPVIGSKEIPWMDQQFTADPTSIQNIYEKLNKSYDSPRYNVKRNQRLLKKYSKISEKVWLLYFTEDNHHDHND